jgi:Flp pilus assembly protein CpaB
LKKNVLPLVIIALVVAVVSTGIFYGLIVSRMDGSARAANSLRYVAVRDLDRGRVLAAEDFRLANAPDPGAPAPSKPEDLVGRKLTAPLGAGGAFTEKILTPFSQRGLSSGIPEGMRAVTVHISESSSVVQMLHPGDHIDVQTLLNRHRGGEQDLEIRTLLQNAVVFNVEDGNGNQQGKAILTVLSSPQDAERLSLADAGARLRVVLRRQGDEKLAPLGGASLLSLGGGPRPQVTSSFVPVVPQGSSPVAAVRSLPARKVAFEVSLLDASPEQIAALGRTGQADMLSVSSAQAETWSGAGAAELLAASRIEADKAGEFHWKSDELGSLRLRLEPMAGGANGGVNLRIQPEAMSPSKLGAATRKVESSMQLASNQVAVVSGFVPAEDVVRWREKLGKSRNSGSGNGKGELVLLIRPVGNQ